MQRFLCLNTKGVQKDVVERHTGTGRILAYHQALKISFKSTSGRISKWKSEREGSIHDKPYIVLNGNLDFFTGDFRFTNWFA